eukprot:TRINITY_DN12010_c0_g1_i1.p1 TRINITY_DN12010_c0_g1~~TRINITY_DN12010_c0_g1_i1.p1  ORF type:complete len:236 (+),score=51.26 TRINITY_DN12010_c0_g1_i1:122-829(+)
MGVLHSINSMRALLTESLTGNLRDFSLADAKLEGSSCTALKLRRGSVQPRSKFKHFKDWLLRGMVMQRYLDRPIKMPPIASAQKSAAKAQSRNAALGPFNTDKHNYSRVPFIPELFPTGKLPEKTEEITKDWWSEENSEKYNAKLFEDILKHRNHRINTLCKKMYNAKIRLSNNPSTVKNSIKEEMEFLKKSSSGDKLRKIVNSINCIGKPVNRLKGKNRRRLDLGCYRKDINLF